MCTVYFTIRKITPVHCSYGCTLSRLGDWLTTVAQVNHVSAEQMETEADGEDCGGSESDRDIGYTVIYNQLIMTRLQTIPNMRLMTLMMTER